MTTYLRVPRDEHARLSHGDKREVRVKYLVNGRTDEFGFPLPLVIWSPGTIGPLKVALVVCEERWREPVGAISTESLRNEGYDCRCGERCNCGALDRFRRYWKNIRGYRWDPRQPTWVYRLRPWDDSDRRRFAERIIEHLWLKPVRDAS